MSIDPNKMPNKIEESINKLLSEKFKISEGDIKTSKFAHTLLPERPNVNLPNQSLQKLAQQGKILQSLKNSYLGLIPSDIHNIIDKMVYGVRFDKFKNFLTQVSMMSESFSNSKEMSLETVYLLQSEYDNLKVTGYKIEELDVLMNDSEAKKLIDKKVLSYSSAPLTAEGIFNTIVLSHTLSAAKKKLSGKDCLDSLKLVQAKLKKTGGEESIKKAIDTEFSNEEDRKILKEIVNNPKELQNLINFHVSKIENNKPSLGAHRDTRPHT